MENVFYDLCQTRRTVLLICIIAASVVVEGSVKDVISAAYKSSNKEYEHLVHQRHDCKMHGIDRTDDYFSSDHQLDLFSEPDERTIKKEKCGYISIRGAKKIVDLTRISSKEYFRINPYARHYWNKYFRAHCSVPNSKVRCNPYAKYRTPDGSCNNLYHHSWGKSRTRQKRFLHPAYDDGCDLPRNTGRNGKPLPSARLVSNNVHSGSAAPTKLSLLTVLTMSYGQFLDHDMVLTPVIKGEDDADIHCCGLKEKRPECLPIAVPPNDPYFRVKCLNMVRSSTAPPEDGLPHCREQLNEVTSYIDASHVYGSTQEKMDRLRLFKHGLLKHHGSQLPRDTTEKGKKRCMIDTAKGYCQIAGDKRVNVVPNLTSLHLLFVREHNRLAKELSQYNPSWDDESLFQEARKIVSAITQHITYNEYLPLILGGKAMWKYGLWSKPKGFQTSYDDRYDASIRNVFAVAAFRFGHSMITNSQNELDKMYKRIKSTNIEKTFHRPTICTTNDGFGCDSVFRWTIHDHAAKADRVFEKGVRDLLFLDRDGKSLDLAAINVQRGRDHGIPPYWMWRKWCGLNYRHLTDHSPSTRQLLLKTYKHIHNIDLFSGAISERHVRGGAVGPTFACILAKQFALLKYGDRFWYENDFKPTGFTKDQLDEVKKVSFSQIICLNLALDRIQRNPFVVQGLRNPYIQCNRFKPMDLAPWQTGGCQCEDERCNK